MKQRLLALLLITTCFSFDAKSAQRVRHFGGVHYMDGCKYVYIGWIDERGHGQVSWSASGGEGCRSGSVFWILADEDTMEEVSSWDEAIDIYLAGYEGDQDVALDIFNEVASDPEF